MRRLTGLPDAEVRDLTYASIGKQGSGAKQLGWLLLECLRATDEPRAATSQQGAV